MQWRGKALAYDALKASPPECTAAEVGGWGGALAAVVSLLVTLLK